jgi:hypothetical protein
MTISTVSSTIRCVSIASQIRSTRRRVTLGTPRASAQEVRPHRDDYEDPDEQVGQLRGPAQLRDTGFHGLDEERAEDRAEHRAAPAHDRGTTDDHRGDDGQLLAGPHGLVEARGALGQGEDGSESDEHAGDDVGDQDASLHPDAGQSRGHRVAAHTEEVTPTRRVAQIPPRDGGQDDGDREAVRHVERAAVDAASEPGQCVGHAVDRLRGEDLQADEEKQIRRAEGDDDGVHPPVGDECAVDQAEDRAGDESHHQTPHQRQGLVAHELGGHDGAHHDRAADGHVDAAGDDHERHADADQRHRRELDEERDDRAGTEERRRCEGQCDPEHDQDRDQGDLGGRHR